MLKSISALLASSLLLAGQAFAVSDAVVFDGGDVVINGGGTGLVFPDSSRQTTATLQGPAGPAGPANTLSIGTVTTGASGSQAAASITGTSPNQVLNLTIPQGPQGPAGVVDGMVKAVHGTINGANSTPSIVTGTGFTVARTTGVTTGSYDITFSAAFSGTPDCVISPVGHTTTGTNTGSVDCEVPSTATVTTTGARVVCKYYYANAFPIPIDDTFTFICVK